MLYAVFVTMFIVALIFGGLMFYFIRKGNEDRR